MQPLFLRVIILSVFFTVFRLTGQDWETYTKKDGILAFPITATYVDSRGIVWFGSEQGLNAFTGSKWYSVSQIENNETGEKQPLKRIKRIYEDRLRNVWFVTDFGVFLFDGTYWVNYLANEDEDNYLADRIFQDRRGWIWITQEYRQEFNEISALGYTLISGSVKMFTGSKWYRFDDDIAESVATKFDISNTYVTKVLQDRQGNMWFATLEGLYMFDGEEWYPFKNEVFKVKKVYDVLEDRSGRIWAGTEAGAAVYENGEWNVFGRKEGLSGNAEYKLKEDSSGDIWAFSRTDVKFTGLSRYHDGRWIHYDPNQLNVRGEIDQLFSVPEGNLAFSQKGLSVLDGEKWHRYGPEDGLDGEQFSLIHRDGYKTIWTTSEKGLFKLVNNRWEMVYQPGEEWEVNVLFIDSRENIWVGTEESGLYFFEAGDWKHYSSMEVLKDNEVNHIFEDRRENIWVTTKKGITKIALEKAH